MKGSQTVLSSYEQQYGGLQQLDAAISAAQQEEWATTEEEAEVFED